MTWVKDWKYIPKEAFLYFPKDDEIKSGSGTTVARRIFETGEPYEEFQRTKLSELNDNLQQKRVTVIPWFTEANKLRFLLAKKFDIDETRKSIAQHCKWRSETFPISITPKIQSFLCAGGIYFCGRDHCYRPIIVFDISKFDLNDSESQKINFMSKILATYFEFMIEELLIEGQVENYVMIVDLNNEGIWSIGGLMKTILGFTTNTYRSRLSVAYILNCPSTITVLWNTAKSFLSQNTVKKINFFNKGVAEPIFSHCNRDQIEVKYAGSKSNIKSGFWPPTCLASKQKYSDVKLIGELDYMNLWKKGKLVKRKVCQEIVDKHSQSTSIVENPVVRVEPQNGQYFLSTIKEESSVTPAVHSSGVYGRQIGGSAIRVSAKPVESNPPNDLLKMSIRQDPQKRIKEPLHSDSLDRLQATYSSLTISNQALPVRSFNSRQSSHPSDRRDEVPEGSMGKKKEFMMGTVIGGSGIVPHSGNNNVDHIHRTMGLVGQSIADRKDHIITQKLTGSLFKEMDIPYEPEMHINQVKTIKTFFHLSTYKNMKRLYYEFI